LTPGPSGGKNDVWRKAKKLRAELLRRLEARDAPPFIDRKIAPETQPNFSSS
jgi:N12 class adenine-specific DNA methylase